MTFKGNYKISLTIAGIQTHRKATPQHIWSSHTGWMPHNILSSCQITWKTWLFNPLVCSCQYLSNTKGVSFGILLNFSESRPKTIMLTLLLSDAFHTLPFFNLCDLNIYSLIQLLATLQEDIHGKKIFVVGLLWCHNWYNLSFSWCQCWNLAWLMHC